MEVHGTGFRVSDASFFQFLPTFRQTLKELQQMKMATAVLNETSEGLQQTTRLKSKADLTH
jgi:hypothetical protein